MDPTLVDQARQTLEAERERIRLELSEEVDHPHVAHGAQTAAATEVSESQRGQQLREREELHLGQIEGASRRIEAGTFGLLPDLRQADRAGAPRSPALGPGLRRLPLQEAPLTACRGRLDPGQSRSRARQLLKLAPCSATSSTRLPSAIAMSTLWRP